MLKKFLTIYHKWRFHGGLDIERHEKDSQNNYTLGWSVFRGEYQPKQVRTNNASKILEILNQQGLNICVCASGTDGKQTDEQVLLDYQWATAYLVSTGKMGENGTSLTAYQDMLRQKGIPERGGRNIDCSLSFYNFANKALLTQESFTNALLHKIQSYYQTYDLNKVLEELDNGRWGHAGSMWYSGYNPSQLPDNCILTPYKGYQVGGHATWIVDYDTDYFGVKVLKCKQSYGEYRHFFYVKFEDFNKVFNYGVIFNSDLPKDKLSWLSLNAGQLVKELNSPKIYVIEGDKKRHIPDEALLQMVLVAFSKPRFIEDKENMLSEIAEGKPIEFAEIPAWAQETVKQMAKWSMNPEWTKATFAKYWPELAT